MHPGIIIGAGALALFALTNTATKLKSIAAAVVGFRVHSVGILSTVCKPRLSFTNPSSSSLKVNSVFLKVLHGGSNLGVITRNTPFEISPKKVSVFETTLELSNLKLIQHFASAIRSGKPLAVQFDGYVNIAGSEVKVDKTIALDLGSFAAQLRNLV